MLVTSGQLSMTITSSIIFVFTSLLFLSGYVLQQQTVRNLQRAIHPPPPPRPSVSPQNATTAKKMKVFGDPIRMEVGGPNQQYMGSEKLELEPAWTSLAYTQLLRHHIDVCDAVMVFAELARQGSPAQRLLLYPQDWDDGSSSDGAQGRIDTSRRLLHMAARRFDVLLLPIGPMFEGAEDAVDLAYPTAGLLSLTRFERLLFFESSGLLLNAGAMDELLASPTDFPITVYAENTASKINFPPSAVVIQPSMQSYHKAMTFIIGTHTGSADSILEMTSVRGNSLDSPYLVSQTFSLALEGEGFNASNYLNQAAYVQLADPAILGPEYDIPRNIFWQARPRQHEARRIWEDLYELYRTERMDICGLDLEPMPTDTP